MNFKDVIKEKYPEFYPLLNKLNVDPNDFATLLSLKNKEEALKFYNLYLKITSDFIKELNNG